MSVIVSQLRSRMPAYRDSKPQPMPWDLAITPYAPWYGRDWGDHHVTIWRTAPNGHHYELVVSVEAERGDGYWAMEAYHKRHGCWTPVQLTDEDREQISAYYDAVYEIR